MNEIRSTRETESELSKQVMSSEETEEKACEMNLKGSMKTNMNLKGEYL